MVIYRILVVAIISQKNANNDLSLSLASKAAKASVNDTCPRSPYRLVPDHGHIQGPHVSQYPVCLA